MDFKCYYDSKIRLLEAVDSSPKVILKYKLTKYCKVPMLKEVDSGDKDYISLKPDDIIEILWEYDSPDNPTVRYIKIMNQDLTYFPFWNSSKIFTWALSNTEEI
jgi:hypothetical protein